MNRQAKADLVPDTAKTNKKNNKINSIELNNYTNAENKLIIQLMFSQNTAMNSNIVENIYKKKLNVQ